MKLYNLLMVISFVLVCSCDDDHGSEKVCSVENPVEDLGWLAAEIQIMSESEMSHFFYVSQASYGFMRVFIFENCCPNCLSIVPVYNCTGDLVGYLGPGEKDINPGLLLNEKVVWKPENSACNF